MCSRRAVLGKETIEGDRARRDCAALGSRACQRGRGITDEAMVAPPAVSRERRASRSQASTIINSLSCETHCSSRQLRP